MTADVRIPLLTWHAMNVEGDDYRTNQHIAFREDLETLHRMGLKIVPVVDIADAVREGRVHQFRGCVGLTLDDCSDFDYHDMPHPVWGPQRSMLRIVEDFIARHGADAQPQIHVTSFAVVSPEARRDLDCTCMIGCRWWNHEWWPFAESTGLMTIESHGWDHNHPTLTATVADVPPGRFDLRTREAADAEIAHASRVLRQLRGRDGDVLFAYPYGEGSAYLVDDYLPRNQAHHGVRAAFSTVPAHVTPDTSPWQIPRFVSGWHWKTTTELEALLAGCVFPIAQPPLKEAGRHLRPPTWRDSLRTWEVHDARGLAGDLFKRSFGHDIPDYPRHFLLVYSPPPHANAKPEVVAYVHQLPFGTDVHLGGGMCVDERAYRRFPKWLFGQVREEGGLATIVTRESMSMLHDSVASFGYVGEPRARAADLRTGFVDTGHPHLMVMWLKEVPEAEKARLVERIVAHGPF